jgi:hypothetical protein
MQFVNCDIINDLTLDMSDLSLVYPAADRIWRYMICAMHYRINTIVIGQNPYSSDLVPHLGAALSQTVESDDTPTTRIFSRHFEDRDAARKFIRSTWTLLLCGRIFVNADYYPSHLGGGNSDIDCIIRVGRMVEFQFYLILQGELIPRRLLVMCSGNLAAHCGSQLSRRLRSICVSVEQMNFRQPAYLFNELPSTNT